MTEEIPDIPARIEGHRGKLKKGRGGKSENVGCESRRGEKTSTGAWCWGAAILRMIFHESGACAWTDGHQDTREKSHRPPAPNSL